MRDIEQALLATVLHSPDYRDMIMDSVRDEDFTEFRDLFQETKRQRAQGIFFTSETLAGRSNLSRNDLDVLSAYALIDANDIDAYRRILQDETTRRDLRKHSSQLQKAMNQERSSLSEVSSILRKMEERINGTDEAIALTPSEIFSREAKKERKEQLKTGVSRIDDGLYQKVGLHRGDINVVLADSGHGKTQWCQYIVSLLAMQGHKGLWFQMEDYDVNTALSLYAKAREHADNVRIVDTVDDIEDIRRQCFGQSYSQGLDFVVIDYIQEVYAQGKYDSRTLEINEITRVLKDIAKKLNVLVLVPSQVTISSYNRSGWQLEPKYSDAQWAQVIKNVAHCMTSVFRPNMVEQLVVTDSFGEMKVKGFVKDTYYPYNSVFAKLVKSRRGEITHDRLLVEHRGDYGLALPEEKWVEQTDKPF